MVNTRVRVPSLKEQDTIIEALDESTLQIDGLIAKKQRLIELLDEKRVALISRAVGLPEPDSSWTAAS